MRNDIIIEPALPPDRTLNLKLTDGYINLLLETVFQQIVKLENELGPVVDGWQDPTFNTQDIDDLLHLYETISRARDAERKARNV